MAESWSMGAPRLMHRWFASRLLVQACFWIVLTACGSEVELVMDGVERDVNGTSGRAVPSGLELSAWYQPNCEDAPSWSVRIDVLLDDQVRYPEGQPLEVPGEVAMGWEA